MIRFLSNSRCAAKARRISRKLTDQCGLRCMINDNESDEKAEEYRGVEEKRSEKKMKRQKMVEIGRVGHWKEQTWTNGTALFIFQTHTFIYLQTYMFIVVHWRFWPTNAHELMQLHQGIVVG